VVNWARSNPGSALHRSLEWDDGVAAENWRIWQVRRLIALHIVYADDSRAMVSLSIDRSGDGGYRSMEDVLPVQRLRDCMLDDALRDLNRLKLKYEKLEELAQVWAAAAAASAKRKRGRRSGAGQSTAKASVVHPSPAE
jgi:hypothetical protein